MLSVRSVMYNYYVISMECCVYLFSSQTLVWARVGAELCAGTMLALGNGPMLALGTGTMLALCWH